jgi:Flp pilus assembly protein TadG
MMLLRRLARDQRGSSAVEFAMVVPLTLILLFGIIDGGRFAWEFNRAEKATQMGARMAVVTNPVAGGITTAVFS